MKTRTLAGVIIVLSSLGAFAQNRPSLTVAPPSVIFEVLALNKDLSTPKKPKYRSPTDLVPSPDGKKIYICEQSAKRIAVFNRTTEKVEGYFRLPNEVTGCVVSSDGTTIYATCGSEIWPSGYVCVIDVGSGKVSKRIKVGHYPRSPVLTPDGTKLFVCNMFSNNMSVIDVATLTAAPKPIALVREPYSADITPDGKTLVIGNSLPNDRSTDSEFVSCMVTLFDVEANKIDTSIRLTRGSHSVFGLTVTPDGKYAFATHLIGKFNLVATTVERGWLHTNNIAMIDIKNRKFVNDVSLDLVNAGTGNPWGIKCTKDGEYMAIAHAGSNELSIIKLKDMIDTVVARTARGLDLQKEFTSMLDSRKRFPVTTKGPRAVAIINDSVYTAGYFDDEAASMEMYTVTQTSSRPAATYTIGEPIPWTGERNGESNFYDAALCFQKWQSCHSCHPLTRPDALNWILGGGAVVAQKNAKNMLYAWWTPPTTWTGRRLHCQQSIVAGIELELFRQATRDLAAPLDTFFMGLKPMPSFKLEKGRLSAAAQRGKAIFYDSTRVDCIVCHPPPLFTDNKFWNTGVPDPFDANTQWVTPHLVECWRTGPYGHLGSYWGIREILELKGHTNASKKLTFEEIDDIVEFVESL
jgi:YVTN family beta-propeller protein